MTLATPAFQSFEDAVDPERGRPRLAALRARFDGLGLDGLVLPRADEHQNEYLPPSAERLAWLTGFTGSAGDALILRERAIVLTDGRYSLQVKAQVPTDLYEVASSVDTPLHEVVARETPDGARLGYVPALHTVAQVTRLAKAAERRGATLVPLSASPLDALWNDRPPSPDAPIVTHPLRFAGESADAKLAQLRRALTEAGADAHVVTAPDSLAWLFNLRGADVPHKPLPLAYALVPREGAALLFAADRLTPDAADALRNVAALRAADDFEKELRALGRAQAVVLLAEDSASAALDALLRDAGATTKLAPDPIALPRARKNAVELAGARAAHERDGAAFVEFLAWFAREAPSGRLTEIDAAVKLEDCRRATGRLKDVSFPTIAGAGPNGAIIHYRVTRDTNRRIEPGFFLVDSGGQYEDGTTDVTRTLVVGSVDARARARFTAVLRGHIALARAVFPEKTTGAQIDALARQFLWERGEDFDHGTGHGVGSYLGVHEGPQRIAKTGHVALEPGMIVSNEPGFYEPGSYGIRLENLMAVERREVAGGSRPTLGFETLTLAPFDRNAIDVDALRPDERAWLDAYHERVRNALGPRVSGEARAWLEDATRPLGA